MRRARTADLREYLMAVLLKAPDKATSMMLVPLPILRGGRRAVVTCSGSTAQRATGGRLRGSVAASVTGQGSGATPGPWPIPARLRQRARPVLLADVALGRTARPCGTSGRSARWHSATRLKM